MLNKFIVFDCDIDRADYVVPVANDSDATEIIMSEETTKRAKRTREPVLLKITASKLAQLIGDAEIGVSRKELRLLVIDKTASDALSEAGL